jgi:hypothetical protein
MELLAECGVPSLTIAIILGADVQDADPPNRLTLLGARYPRPCSGSAEESYKISPPHATHPRSGIIQPTTPID